MVAESEWSGLIAGRGDPSNELTVRACLQPGKLSASSPFLAEASDGKQWWVKPPQADLAKALITEYVVGRAGQLIGAPVCDITVIEIPPTLLPWEFKPGIQLPTGFGTATRDLSNAVREIRGTLEHRSDDDNARRHGGVYALVDWCYGDDLQWLLDAGDDWRLYSHDHGWYLPPGGADWTIDQLRATADQAKAIVGSAAGLDKAHLEQLAQNLQNVTRESLRKILIEIPVSWPVLDNELECLGWYLEHRAPMVASRLRAL